MMDVADKYQKIIDIYKSIKTSGIQDEKERKEADKLIEDQIEVYKKQKHNFLDADKKADSETVKSENEGADILIKTLESYKDKEVTSKAQIDIITGFKATN